MDWNKIFDGSSKFAAVIAAALSIWLTFKYDTVKKEIESSQAKLDLKISQMNGIQDSIDFDRQHRFRIYEKVYDAVKSGKPNEKNLAAALVIQMLPGDTFQENLLRIIRGDSDDKAGSSNLDSAIAAFEYIKKVDAEKKIQVAQFVRKDKNDKNNYTIDIFYLVSKEASLKDKAGKLQTILAQNGFKGARVRKLSDLINARSGYRVYTNQVRVEVGNEKEAAFGKEISSLAAMNLSVVPVSQSSPGYISVFIVE